MTMTIDSTGSTQLMDEFPETYLIAADPDEALQDDLLPSAAKRKAKDDDEDE